MQVSEFHLATTRETPADAEIVSHQLMLRAGMIRKLSSGIFTWSPLGLRVLRRVEQVVREEMNRAGALELLMPAVQPAELWRETGRWDQFGPQLLKITDRGEREFCFGPTHEEVITDLARNEIRSYKQLPVNFYQIQTKFRDEIRPRFGVMRAREFIMKDAYSFHLDSGSLAETYQRMYDAYSAIFTRLGLKFRSVEADSGAIGGSQSHEFHVLADSGEDAIVFASDSDYAANVERAEALAPTERPRPTATLEKVATPKAHSVEEVANLLDVDTNQVLKTLLVRGSKADLVALVLRGDHELNEVKAGKLDALAEPFEFADEKAIRQAVGCGLGSIGPVGLEDKGIPVFVDRSAAASADFVCGANEDGHHLRGVNWQRDVSAGLVVDLRNVVDGDPSPDGGGTLSMVRGIEVGHIFQLGDKYSTAMGASVLDEDGKAIPLVMGCYGIGVSRIVAAAIEQNHDDAGIIWPLPLAPFEVALVPMNMHKSHRVRDAAEALYQELTEAGVEVLFDDRKARPGVMFADMELIGIPLRLVVGDRGLDQGVVEFRPRPASDNEMIPRDQAVARVLEFLGR